LSCEGYLRPVSLVVSLLGRKASKFIFYSVFGDRKCCGSIRGDGAGSCIRG